MTAEAQPWSRGLTRFRRCVTDVVGRWGIRGILLVTLGLVIRLLLAPWTTSVDITNLLGGLVAFRYTGHPYLGYVYSYPPVPVMIDGPLFLGLSYFVPPYSWFTFSTSAQQLFTLTGGVSPLVPTPLFSLVVKAPLIFADFLTAFAIYKIAGAMGLSRRVAQTGFLLYWLSPLTIFESAVHAPVDSMVPALVLLFAYGIQSQRPFYAGLGAALGVFTIFFPSLLVVLGFSFYGTRFLLLSQERHASLRQLAGFATGLAVPVIIFLPVLTSFLYLNQTLLGGAGFTQCVCGDTFWGLANNSWGWLRASLAPPIYDNLQAIGLGLRVFDVALAILLGVWLASMTDRATRRPPPFATYAIVLGFLSVLLLSTTGVNPQYFLWPFSVLIVAGFGFTYLHKFVLPIGILAVIGEVAIQGPFVFLIPLSVYTGVIPGSTIVRLTTDYWLDAWGPFAPWYMWNVVAVFGGILLTAIAYWSLRYGWELATSPQARSPSPQVGPPGSAVRAPDPVHQSG